MDIIAKSSLVGHRELSPRNLGNFVKSYSHQIDAFGGYKTARISLAGNEQDIQHWADAGLSRHIETYSDDGKLIWEGFVNSVTIGFGPLQLTIGPYVEICNRVYAKYSDFSTGAGVLTSTAENLTSQRSYGIRSRVISVGQVSSTNADKIRDTYLNENMRPKISQSLGSASGVSIDLDCLGYADLLDFSYFNATGGTYTLREKIIDILDSEPNSVFSTDYSNLAVNTLSVATTESDGKKGIDLIKELVNMGDDGTNARAIFGVYSGRKARYEIDNQQVFYYQRLKDGATIRNVAGNIIPVYDILPGKWIKFLDFNPSLSSSVDTVDNPSYMFIESVSFEAPDRISLTGGNAETLAQRLGKLGVTGIS